MKSSARIIVLLTAALVSATASTALAEDFTLADGSRWHLDEGGRLTRVSPRPEIVVTMDLHTVGISCADGLIPGSGRVAERPSYLPAGVHPVALVERGTRQKSVVCIDAGQTAAVVTILWPQEQPTAADQESVELMLADVAAGVKSSPSPPASRVSLFHPARMTVPLDARTGVWVFVNEYTDDTKTLLLRRWPMGSPAAIRITRPRAPQRCDSVGLRQWRPTWAPESYYEHGATRGTAQIACFDPKDGHALLVEPMMESLDDKARVRAMLEVIAATAGAATPAPAPAYTPPAPATAYTPPPAAPASTTYPPSTTSGSGDAYGVSSDADRPRRRGPLHPRWRLELHQLSMPAMSAGDVYALGVGASALFLRGYDFQSTATGLEYEGAVAIDKEADVALDGSAGLVAGLRLGDGFLKVLATGGGGFDGFGLGADDGRPRLDTELYGYLGLRGQVNLSRSLRMDVWYRWLDRSGELDERRYGAELTIVRRRGRAVALGLGKVVYDDTAERLAFTLGLR